MVLYNGNGGAIYDTDPLPTTIPAAGVVVLDYPSNGIQNGSPDGVALVDAAGAVVQFLSYEGVMTALGGPADGMLSTDIGVAEAGTEPAGQSLQLTGTGSVYGDFTWTGPATATKGAANTGQAFQAPGGPPPPPPPPAPEAPLALISAVQGSRAASPREGERLSVEAVVTTLKTRNDAVVSYFLQGGGR